MSNYNRCSECNVIIGKGKNKCEDCIKKKNKELREAWRIKVETEGWDWSDFIENLFKIDNSVPCEGGLWGDINDYDFIYNCGHQKDALTPCSECNMKGKKSKNSRLMTEGESFIICTDCHLLSGLCIGRVNDKTTGNWENAEILHNCEKIAEKRRKTKHSSELKKHRILNSLSASEAIEEAKLQIKQILKKYKADTETLEKTLKELDKISATSQEDVLKKTQELERQIIENSKKQTNAPTNYFPYILGGIGIIAVGAILFLLIKKRKKIRY